MCLSLRNAVGLSGCVLGALLACGGPARADDAGGLTLRSADPTTWSRWQGRLSLGLTAQPGQAETLSSGAPGLKVSSVRLLGDYYFTESLIGNGNAGGFRATSGVILGSRSTLWSGQASLTPARYPPGMDRHLFGPSTPPLLGDSGIEAGPVPYLGVGYSGMSGRSRWSFSADVGLMALNPGNAVKLGRVFSGAQGVDELLRDLRLAPVLQLGVSYSF